MEKPVIPTQFKDHFFGIDQGSNLVNMPDQAFEDALNMEGDEVGLVSTRGGTSKFTDAAMEGKTIKIYDFQKSNGEQHFMAWSGTKLYEIVNSTPVIRLSGLTINRNPGVTSFNDRMYFGNGIESNRKYDGINLWDVSLEEPTAFPSLNTAAAGSITLATGQKYVVTFYNSTTGEESNPYSASNLATAPTTGIINLRSVVVTQPPAPTDPQISHWRIYKTTDGGATFFLHTTVVIATTTYTDNTTVPATTTELQTNNDRSPLSEIWESAFGSIFLVPNSDLQSIQYSKTGNGAAYPLTNIIYAGRNDNDPIKCLKFKNNLLWIGKERSTWILTAHPSTGAIPTKVADRGCVNKDALDGSDQHVFSFAKNKAFYNFKPTDFSLSEIRYSYRSFNARSFMDMVNESAFDRVRVLNFNTKTKNQILVGVPKGDGINTINYVAVYDGVLSKLSPREESWWFWKFGFDIASIAAANVNGEDVVLIGTDDGWIHKFPDLNSGGDSAAYNGSSTGNNTSTTLKDTTKNWTVNVLAGTRLTLLTGAGSGQSQQIISNTSNTITVGSAWAVIPSNTTTYTIGGFDHYCFSNWKNYGNEALRKRMRFIRPVLRQAGNYTIDIIAKIGFVTADGSAQVHTFNLTGAGGIWGVFLWGINSWMKRTVVATRIKFAKKFNSIQFGFRNKLAGQPFQLEMYTTFHQDLYWRSTLL